MPAGYAVFDFTEHPAEALTTLHLDCSRWTLEEAKESNLEERVPNKVDRLAPADRYILMTRQLCVS